MSIYPISGDMHKGEEGAITIPPALSNKIGEIFSKHPVIPELGYEFEEVLP